MNTVFLKLNFTQVLACFIAYNGSYCLYRISQDQFILKILIIIIVGVLETVLKAKINFNTVV